MSGFPEFSTVTLGLGGSSCILTLNRPKARNAIDDQMRADLRDAIAFIGSDPAIRGLVITGAGSVFCSGGDIKGMKERIELGARAGEVGWRRQRAFHETLQALFGLDKPTVAAVNGPAYGLGLDLALTCDRVLLASTATVAASFAKRGLVPDGGGLFHLPRRIGLARTKDLVFTGRDVEPEESLAIGLADDVLEPGAVLPAALAWLGSCAANPAMAQALAKDILNRSHELSYEQVNMMASEAQAYCYTSPEHQESVRSFLAGREASKREKP